LATNENLGVEEPRMLQRAEFEKVVRRFSSLEVQTVLQETRRRLSLYPSGEKTLSSLASELGYTTRGTIFRTLFQTEPLENLWDLYVEVSKAATPSHQTPKARVTSERKDESHHTPI
jgi:hypothetical protein